MKTLKGLLTNPLSFTGLVIVLGFIVIAILAPVLAPPKGFDPYRIPRYGYKATPKPPSPEHPFGLSEGQYDIYYGVIWGTRTAFRVGLSVIGAALLIGVIVGSVSGYFGGWLDELVMRITDIFFAFPFLIAALALATILGKGLTNMIIALAAFSWPGYARLVRGDILAIKERDYVQAARALGASHFRVIRKHVLPNAIYPLLVIASLDMGSIVLAASALSFLGIGTEVGYADWGQMISFSRNWILGIAGGDPFEFWYTVFYPGMAIVLFVLGWNLLGDAFRDILDPRLRGRRSS